MSPKPDLANISILPPVPFCAKRVVKAEPAEKPVSVIIDRFDVPLFLIELMAGKVAQSATTAAGGG